MKLVKIFMIVIALAGCATTKQSFVFDGSSPESTSNGISKVIKKLKGAEKPEFVVALLRIQYSDVNSVTEILGNPSMMNINYQVLSKKINGLNYYQVLKLASKSKTTATATL